MIRLSLTAFAVIASVTSVSSCAPRVSAISPRVLAAADPAAAEAPFTPPANAFEGERPRTLDLDIADPARMKRPEAPPEIGTPADENGHDHSGHGAPPPTPKPAVTATPRAQPQAETIYACPMHPEVRDTKPGTCPKCGMTLEPVPAPATPKPKPTPTPKPTSKPSAPPSGKPTPTPGGHDHSHGSTS